MSKTFLPGQTLGIIGGGEVSFSLALQAKQMGFRVAALSEIPGDPLLQLADYPLSGRLDDDRNLRTLEQTSDILTYGTEHMDANRLELLHKPLPQKTDLLSLTQDRYLEKVFLDDQNINIAPYQTVLNINDIKDGIRSIGYPSVLKPIQKGIGRNRQHIIYDVSDISSSVDYLNSGTYLLESWIPYRQELAVMAIKSADKDLYMLPIIDNVYQNHALIQSMIPAQISDPVRNEIYRIAKVISDAVNYVGVFGIEFFLTENQTLYVKRLIPNAHVIGNIFNDTLNFSMYDLHLRALFNWPMPTIRQRIGGISMTINQRQQQQLYQQITVNPDWHYHYYLSPIINRDNEAKVGYVNLTGPDLKELGHEIRNTKIWNV